MQPSSDSFRARRRLLRLACSGAAACLAAPASAIMAGAAPDTPAARVDTNSSSSRWTGVVSVVVGGSPFSGVLISPLHVLTAAHVAGGQPPANVQVVFNVGGSPQTRSVAGVSTYPGTVFPYDDMVVLTLASAPPAGAAAYPIVDMTVATGTTITLVGYGASGQGDVGPSVPASATVKRTGRNVLDQYTDRFDSSGRTSPFFVYDFDGPTGNGARGGPTLGNTIETAVASGDSGSPVFVDSAVGPALFGMSTITFGFSASSASTSVFGSGGGGLVLGGATYLAWLRTQTQGRLNTVGDMQYADIPTAPISVLALFGAALGATVLRQRAWTVGAMPRSKRCDDPHG